MNAATQSDEFYDALAPAFDVMTDWEARLATEGPFLEALLGAVGARRVLDAACGSGGHAVWLAKRGYRAAGVDASRAMIDMAREKAAAAGVQVPLARADLADLTPTLLPGLAPFDAVLCLGNSLPHILDHAGLVAALRAMAGVLAPGGLLLLQNLNYDRRWRLRPRWFGAQGGRIGGEEVLVWRFADYDQPPGLISFHMALFRRASPQDDRDWQVDVHTTLQRPLLRADLARALDEAGLTGVHWHGRMALPPADFDPEESDDLVAAAHKG